MLQILSVSLFEKTALFDLLSEESTLVVDDESLGQQIDFFDYLDKNS